MGARADCNAPHTGQQALKGLGPLAWRRSTRQTDPLGWRRGLLLLARSGRVGLKALNLLAGGQQRRLPVAAVGAELAKQVREVELVAGGGLANLAVSSEEREAPC